MNACQPSRFRRLAGLFFVLAFLGLFAGCPPDDTRRQVMNENVSNQPGFDNGDAKMDPRSRYQHREPSVDATQGESKMTFDIDDDPNRGKPKHGLSDAEINRRLNELKQTIQTFDDKIVGDEVVGFSDAVRHESNQSTLEVTLKDGRRYTLTGVFKDGKLKLIKVFETGMKVTINNSE